jgi:hypothetical protein
VIVREVGPAAEDECERRAREAGERSGEGPVADRFVGDEQVVVSTNDPRDPLADRNVRDHVDRVRFAARRSSDRFDRASQLRPVVGVREQ